MRRPLSALEQRACAVLLLGFALALLYWGIIQPWWVAPQQAISAQMADLRQAQRRYAGLLAQSEQLHQQAASGSDQEQASAGLLPGEDRSAAAAALMQYGAEVVLRHQRDGAGCELLNRTPLVDDPGAEPFAQVQATFNLNCAIEPVEAIVFDLETAQPVLFVTQLRIERGDAQANNPPGRLEVQLTVAGYLQQPIVPATDEGDSL